MMQNFYVGMTYIACYLVGQKVWDCALQVMLYSTKSSVGY